MATTKRTTKRKNGHATTRLSTKLKRGLTQNRKTLKAASKKLTHAAYEAKERFNDVEETVEKYAKTNPWKTMGITLVAGVIAGRIIGMLK